MSLGGHMEGSGLPDETYWMVFIYANTVANNSQNLPLTINLKFGDDKTHCPWIKYDYMFIALHIALFLVKIMNEALQCTAVH